MVTSHLSEASKPSSESATVKVWDLFVRVIHWTVAIAFFVAYFTEDEVLTLHVWAGYTIGVLVVLRIVWGFVGPTHARFTDFLYGPFTALAYLRELVAFRARRYVGHSPAGAAMVFALLIGLSATILSGLELYAVEENAGPFAMFGEVLQSNDGNRTLSTDAAAAADAEPEREEDEDQEGAGELWKELHEVLANVMLALALLHIGGVLLASVVHRENLARAMVTGRKRVQ